jgi:hypothetical protein
MGSTGGVAANQARVWEKVRESRFFLTLMMHYEGEPEKFGFCLSAFLSGFRSIAYRLMRFTAMTRGRRDMEALKKRLDSRRDIDFLRGARDVEVHGDGVVILRAFSFSVSDSIPERWWSRWNPKPSRWESRSAPAQVELRHRGWQFGDHAVRNVIELCRHSLDEVEEIVRQTLAIAP